MVPVPISGFVLEGLCDKRLIFLKGWVAEWFKAPVLKTWCVCIWPSLAVSMTPELTEFLGAQRNSVLSRFIPYFVFRWQFRWQFAGGGAALGRS
jgi:hypothetical protein